MKTLDEILAIIGIEPNSEYDTNYTNVKKMFVEWANGIVGEPGKHAEFCRKRGEQFKKCHACFVDEQRACIEKENT